MSPASGLDDSDVDGGERIEDCYDESVSPCADVKLNGCGPEKARGDVPRPKWPLMPADSGTISINWAASIQHLMLLVQRLGFDVE